MANFRVDTDGNLWIGTNISENFATAKTEAKTKFYVENDGTIKATEGTIGGIVIDADGIESDNYEESTDTGWRLDNATGIAQFFDIDINLDASNNNTPSNTQFIGFGVGSIYGNSTSNDLVLSAPQIAIRDSSGTPGATSATLIFTDGTYSQPGFYAEEDNAGQRAEFYFTNGTHDIFHTRSGFNTLYLDATYLSVYDGIGTVGDVLTRTSNGLEWTTTSGAHSDSDHTSFLTQSQADNRYVNESDHTHSNLIGDTAFNNHVNNSTAHGTFDNYSYWRPRINGSNISGTIGSTDSLNFVAGNNMTISESGSGGTRNITFSGSGTAHTHTSVLSISVLDLNLYRDIKPSSSNSKRVGTSSTNRMLDVFSRDFHGGTFYGTLVNSSSQNTKTNIEDTGLGLDFIEALPVKQFNYITADHSDKKYTGVIAEDVTAILEANGWDDYYLVVDDSEKYSYNTRCSHPVNCDDSESFYCEDDCCSSYFKYTEEDGSVSNWLHHTVEECEEYEVDGNRHPHFNYYQLIGPLVKSVQELSTQISDLTARVEALEG